MAKMVQVFMVVRCYSCETFQVQQVKKTNKWVCKVCNGKQSVIKVYGKGGAADCRKHVQMLNVMRGEKEAEKWMENHPPEDYASTFQTEDQPLQLTDELPDHHPVLVSGKQSKWTTFIEPQDSEEDSDPDSTYTLDKNAFVQAHKKARKQVTRSASDRGPHPRPLTKSARATLPIRSTTAPKRVDTVYPYSSVSQEMEMLLDDHTARLKSSKSCYTLVSEKYTKLDDGNSDQTHSQSLQDLSVGPPQLSHQDRMAIIREDISRFSTEVKQIPNVSSRWSKFMCESESDSEEKAGEEGGDGGDPKEADTKSSAHLLSSRSTVAKYMFEQTA